MPSLHCCEYGTFRFGVRFGPNWVHNIGPPPKPGTGLPVQFGRYAEPRTGLQSSSEKFRSEPWFRTGLRHHYLCSAFLVGLHFESTFSDGLLLYSQSLMYLNCLARPVSNIEVSPSRLSLFACPQTFFFAPQVPTPIQCHRASPRSSCQRRSLGFPLLGLPSPTYSLLRLHPLPCTCVVSSLLDRSLACFPMHFTSIYPYLPRYSLQDLPSNYLISLQRQCSILKGMTTNKGNTNVKIERV